MIIIKTSLSELLPSTLYTSGEVTFDVSVVVWIQILCQPEGKHGNQYHFAFPTQKYFSLKQTNRKSKLQMQAKSVLCSMYCISLYCLLLNQSIVKAHQSCQIKTD